MTRIDLLLQLRSLAKRSSFGGRILFAQRLLRRAFRYASGVARVDDFDGDLSIDLRLSEHMQRRIFWMGYYNREIVALLDEILHPGMILIDIGANIGEISLVAAKRVGPEGQVIAFEPIDAIADILELNVSRNAISVVKIERIGLSDHIGSAPIFASCGQGHASDEHHGLGSLYGENSSEEALQTIPLTTLDAYLRDHPLSRIDIIKIDIEGAELPCLRGAENTLRNYRPRLIVEVQDESSTAAGYQQAEILNYLEGLGYTFQSIVEGGRLRELQAASLVAYQNVLCTHSQPHSPVDAAA